MNDFDCLEGGFCRLDGKVLAADYSLLRSHFPDLRGSSFAQCGHSSRVCVGFGETAARQVERRSGCMAPGGDGTHLRGRVQQISAGQSTQKLLCVTWRDDDSMREIAKAALIQDVDVARCNKPSIVGPQCSNAGQRQEFCIHYKFSHISQKLQKSEAVPGCFSLAKPGRKQLGFRKGRLSGWMRAEITTTSSLQKAACLCASAAKWPSQTALRH